MNNDFNNENNEQKPWESEKSEPMADEKPWDSPIDTEDYVPPVYERREREAEKQELSSAVEEKVKSGAPEPQTPPPAEEAPAPDFSSQSYVPPYYNAGEQSPKKHKKTSNAPVIILSVVSILSFILLATLFAVIWKNNWITPQDAEIGTQDGEENIDKTDDGTPSNGTPSDDLQEDNEQFDTGNADVNIDIEDTEGKNQLNYGAVYEKCAPAAVGILCTKYVSYSSMFGQSSSYEEHYVGSGFIIDENGYIATNAHVVAEMDKIVVYLADGTQLDAALIGCDDLSDIAVVKVESEEPLPVMQFGDSSVLKVGDVVTAIGTPADITLAGTFTQGIISAVDREITVEENGVKKTMRLLQTDATINPGNSGGPLLNMYGQVIGINTLKLTDEFEGIGFAIPSMYAKQVVEAIIQNNGDVDFDPENGYVSVDEKPQMGIANSQEITRYMSSVYGVPEGVQILLLDQGCSLEKNGARVGDIIVEMNGAKITNLEELRAERDKVKPREEATLKVYRNGEYYDITFKMGSNISTK